MNKQELIERLQDIEWEDFEVKEAKSEIPKNSWESVSAFCNTAGGWLIFGVKQVGKNFEIVGVKNAEKIEQDFLSVLRSKDKFNRIIEVKCKKYNFEGKIVLGFYIFQKNPKERPVYFGNSQNNTFIRVGSGDQRATKEEINSMHRNSSFEEKDNELCDFGIEGIDEKSFESYKNYFRVANPGHRYLKLSDKDFLEKLRVLDNGKLTLGGLLVFGKEDYILKKISSFKIDYLEIGGVSYEDALNRYNFRLICEYNLFNCFFNIYEKLIKNIEVPFKLKGAFRDDGPPQLQAIREALVNLLIHSDYYSSGTFRIRVFEDRIEFFNSGGLPKDLEFILKKDFTQPRSPIVAKIFRYLGLSDGLGSGFHKMISGWKEYYNLEPIIESDFDYYSITFPFIKSDEKGNEKGNEKYSSKSRQKWILKQLKLKGEINSGVVVDFFKISKKYAVSDLNGLINSSNIKKEGRGRATKYFLVEVKNEK